MSSFILASASPRRLDLLRQVGLIPAQTVAADVDETPKRQELPEHYALRVALSKAQAVAQHYPGSVILAADTTVACGRRILPKAESEKEAKKCLALLSGRRHRVYTAVAVIDRQGRECHRVVMTQVRFKRLTDAEMNDYLGSREWQGKAGGYAIQGLAAAYIPWIGGSYGNVVGLPLPETVQLLARAGVHMPD